jgi:hypothetical protein
MKKTRTLHLHTETAGSTSYRRHSEDSWVLDPTAMLFSELAHLHPETASPTPNNWGT